MKRFAPRGRSPIKPTDQLDMKLLILALALASITLGACGNKKYKHQAYPAQATYSSGYGYVK